MSSRTALTIPSTRPVDRTHSGLNGERWRLFGGLATVAAVTIAMSAVYRVPGQFGIDDAYITYRYAQNLSRGLGFVFNPGSSPVLGTSTPLYALLLAAGARLGADIPSLSMLFGAFAEIAVSLFIAALGWRCGQGAAGIAAAIFLAALPITWSAVAGMETPLYTTLIVGALCAEAYGRRRLAFLLAALAVLTRMDGAAVLAALLVIAWREKTWSWRDAAPALVLVGGWLLYAWWQFGSPLPASGVAKLAHSAGISGRFLPTPLILAGLAAGIVLSKERIPLLLTSWLAFYVAGLLALHMPDFLWYYTPATTASVVLLLVFGQRLIGQTLHWLRRPGAEYLAATAVLCGGAFAVAVAAPALTAPRTDTVHPSAYQNAGMWLRSHALPGDTVVAYETGTVAYLSGLKTIDLLGLTEPAALPHLRIGDYAWAIRDRQPTYVFTQENSRPWPVTDAIYALPEFREHYRIVARWPYRPDQAYLLYQRT